MEKRYYWLKLQEGFFGSLRIKKLRRMKRGDTLLCIYLKMQLASLTKEGVIEYKGIEEDIASELAFDLNERVSDMRECLKFLDENGLLERLDETHYLLPWVISNTGSENASAQRVRDCRERKALHCNEDVTDVKRTCNVEKRREEKEIDIERDKERDRRSTYRKKINPALKYGQSEIKQEDFEAMIINLGGDDNEVHQS